jgi:formamidopyrimidine-DNA glycosylase
MHPKRKLSDISEAEMRLLFDTVKTVLREMTELGGRDTERDLYGEPGGYVTLMSRNTVGTPCPACATPVLKASYMGGSVYYCPGCQIP